MARQRNDEQCLGLRDADGGAALMTTISLTNRGPAIDLPYAAIVLASGAFLRVEEVRPFNKRFALSPGVFMFATILLYLFTWTSVRSNSRMPYAWFVGSIETLAPRAAEEMDPSRDGRVFHEVDRRVASPDNRIGLSTEVPSESEHVPIKRCGCGDVPHVQHWRALNKLPGVR